VAELEDGGGDIGVEVLTRFLRCRPETDRHAHVCSKAPFLRATVLAQEVDRDAVEPWSRVVS
jgi:hypothetical protein